MMIDRVRHANVAIFVPHAGCVNRCTFCNQRHIAGQSCFPTAQDVVNACTRALETLDDQAVAQVAFFGGSFTAIERTRMEELLQAAAPFLKDGRIHGIRISTRPDAIDDEVLCLLRKYGVTAIELGAQSMDDTVLAACRRGHTAQQVREAADMIRKAGFSLGLQMMTGLPGDTEEGAMETARQLARLCPDTVRIYPTVVMEGTDLAEAYAGGHYQPQRLEDAVALCARLLTFFEQHHIPVIRLGLHAEESMQQHCLAGPMHPAFRELCESELFLQKAKKIIENCDIMKVELSVHPACVSRMVGHKRKNIRYFADLGYTVTVVADAAVPYGEIKRREVTL